MNITRRKFLKVSVGSTVVSTLYFSSRAIGATSRRYKAAVIGRTGGGDYGHDYDQIFKGIENVTVVAVADSNKDGLEKAAARSGALRKYTNYLEMLEKEKPDLVSIAPRHPDCHKEMALAAIEHNAHIFMEKPMTATVEDADAIVKAAEKKNIQIIIAHNRRWNVDFVRVKALLSEGLIGNVRGVYIHGKQDARSGGEDLIVLGTHDFDLMRFYFGNPLWCFASVRQNGKDITKKDIRSGKEPITVAGDSINAMFGFPNNITVHWESIRTNDHWNTNFSKREKWAFEILGTKGIIAYQSGLDFAYLESPFFANKEGLVWKQLPQPSKFNQQAHQRHPILNLIYAIETNTQPVCSAYDGRWTIEMVSAVYQSQRDGKRITFPLKDRTDPLKNWKDIIAG